MIRNLAKDGLKYIKVIKPDNSLNTNSPWLIGPVVGFTLMAGTLALETQNLRTKQFEGRKVDESLKRQIHRNRERDKQEREIKLAPANPKEEQH